MTFVTSSNVHCEGGERDRNYIVLCEKLGGGNSELWQTIVMDLPGCLNHGFENDSE